MTRPSKLEIEGDALIVSTPYDAALVASIKGLPNAERKYDPTRKVWRVSPKHAPSIAQWIEAYLGETVSIPLFTDAYQVKVSQKLTVRYVGTCKARTDGSSSAYGLLGLGGKDWGVIFPEQVLRDFFDGSVSMPNGRETYFALLGVGKDASNDEVRAGFRRMAMQWHPDHCKEVNAAEVFMRVKTAYDTLNDPAARARYEAGLMLEAMTKDGPSSNAFGSPANSSWGYRAPLRSGIIHVEGLRKLGVVEANKILSWEDIIDGDGRVLIVSWPAGAKEPVEEWL